MVHNGLGHISNWLAGGRPHGGDGALAARLVRSLRSVLNVSRMPTADLFRLHSIRDPVEKIRDRMSSRLRRLTRWGTAQPPKDLLSPLDQRSRGLISPTTSGPFLGLATATPSPTTLTGVSADVTTLPYLIQNLQDILQEVQRLPAPSEASQQLSHACPRCDARFVSDYGLHMHVTRMHRDKVDRYIPGDFDRSLHAKDGLPISAACDKEFKSGRGFGITCSLERVPNLTGSGLCPPHLTHRSKVQH